MDQLLGWLFYFLPAHEMYMARLRLIEKLKAEEGKKQNERK
jgi:hypothetical protein